MKFIHVMDDRYVSQFSKQYDRWTIFNFYKYFTDYENKSNKSGEFKMTHQATA